MTGECTGKVRSTPTWKLTLRTVKVSRTLSPWRRMTTPWKTWTRARVPSMMLTCTLTLSPGRKSGTSVRRDAASTPERRWLMANSLSATATGRLRCLFDYSSVRMIEGLKEWSPCRDVVGSPEAEPGHGTRGNSATNYGKLRPSMSDPTEPPGLQAMVRTEPVQQRSAQRVAHLLDTAAMLI